MMFPLNHGVMAAHAAAQPQLPLLMAVTGEGAEGLKIYSADDWSTVASVSLLDCGPVAFSPDGALLAVGHSGGLAIVETASWSVIPGTPLDIPLADVAWSPDGSLLAVSHGSGSFLTVIDTSNWSIVAGTPALPGTGRGVAFSPDGSMLVATFAPSPSWKVYNTSDWSEAATLPSVSTGGFKPGFSPDGQYLAMAHSGSPGNMVVRTSDWSQVGTPYLSSTGYAAVFAPDSSFVSFSIYSSGALRLLPTDTWSAGYSGTYGGAYGRDTDVSPDSKMIALVGYVNAVEGLLKVIRDDGPGAWTEVSGTPAPSGRVFGVSFNPGVLP